MFLFDNMKMLRGRKYVHCFVSALLVLRRIVYFCRITLQNMYKLSVFCIDTHENTNGC